MSGITQAMVLAAGKGVRMRPITATMPKPMIHLAGKTLIDRAIDNLHAAGVKRIVVNTHYLAQMLQNHLGKKRDAEIVISHEKRLLDTGGGVANALDQFGDEPFFVMNSDAVWIDGPQPTLRRMSRAWSADRMDALLLMVPMARVPLGMHGRGDYFLGPRMLLRRRKSSQVAPYLFGGVQVMHRALFEGAPEGPFSLNLLYDRAEASARLCGIVHDGQWLHVGSPGELEHAETVLTDKPQISDYL